MTIQRSTALSLLFIGLTIVGFLSFIPDAHAQARTPGATPTPAASNTDAQRTADNVTAALGGANRVQDVTGFEACSADFLRNHPGGGDKTCGMVATQAGTTPYNRNPYRAGDTVKCYYGDGFYELFVQGDFTVAGTEQCAISTPRPGGGFSVQYHNAGLLTQSSAVPDANGALQDQSTNSFAAAAADVGDQILRAVASAILTFANFLLGLAGALLNFVVYYCVFKFGSLIGNSPGVLLAWGILRDIANMMLLFGFVFLGFATILNTDKFPTKKAIPRLLIFAILMNFSLFATEAVIDLSNGMSSLLYTQADPQSTQCDSALYDNGSTNGQCDGFLNYGIAGHIMQSTGLSSIWQNNGNTGASPTALLGLAVFATIGFIVLLAAAIMLVIRLISLTFLMVVSPIGFAGMALPFFQKFSSEWWNRVIHQSFFAPIMFLLIFISLKIADSFTEVGVNGGLAGGVAGLQGAALGLAAAPATATTTAAAAASGIGGSGGSGLGTLVTDPSVSTMGIVLVFMLVCGFLLSSVIVAHRFGAMGASGAISVGKNFILGAYGGTAGFVGRNTLGRAGASAQKSYQKALGSNKFARTALVNTGLDSAIMGATGAIKNGKYGGSSSFEDSKKSKKERMEALEKEGRKAQLKKDLDGALATSNDDKVFEILEKMSTKELEELNVLKKSGDKLDTLIKNLSPEKFAAIVKDGGSMTEAQKNTIRESRFRDVRNLEEDLKKVESNPNSTQAEKDAAKKALKDRVKKYSSKDLENGPSDLFNNDIVAQGLSNSQRDDLLKGGKLSAAAARNVKRFDPVEEVNAALTAQGAAATAALITNKRLNPKQVARLSPKVLQNAEVAAVLNKRDLQAIAEKNELDPQEIIDIGNLLRTYGSGDVQTYLTSNPAAQAYWS